MNPAAPPDLPLARIRLRSALASSLAASLLFLGIPPAASQTFPAAPSVRRAYLEVHLDPDRQALYAKARLILRNDAGVWFDRLELAFPAPLGSRVEVTAVWDRRSELPWRLEPVESDEPGLLIVALRSVFEPGDKLDIVVRYQVDLKELPPDAAAVVDRTSARLDTTGWYPVPVASDPVVPQEIDLTLRLPRQWSVTAPAKLKQTRDGAALATYELKLKPVEAGQPLIRASAPP